MSLVKSINPGRLNHRIEIMRYQETADELGNTVNQLVPWKTVWGEFRPLRGSESLEYYKINNQETYKITMRYQDITETDVIKFRNRQFKINYIINPLMDDRYLEVYVTEDINHEVKELSDG